MTGTRKTNEDGWSWGTINDTLGAEELERDAEAGRVRIRFQALPAFENGRGVVQGGMQTAFLDNAMSRALALQLPPGTGFASLEIKTTYVGPARSGVLIGEGWIVRRGRSIAFTEGRLMDADGTLLATASMTAKISARN